MVRHSEENPPNLRIQPTPTARRRFTQSPPARLMRRALGGNAGGDENVYSNYEQNYILEMAQFI